MKIAITGEKGFLGYHLTQYYKWVKGFEVVELGKNYIENINLLHNCSLLIHCAGVNKGKDVYEKNISLTRNLVEVLINHNINIDIKFTSSTQENNGSEYGNAKLQSKILLQNYCYRSKTKFESYKIPNLFGPFGKPNYNSFINTFCYNIVNNKKCQHNNKVVTLCYVYDAIKTIDNQIEFNITKKTVYEIYKLLRSFHTDYSKGIIPDLTNIFEKNLFNTYRSFSKIEFKQKTHTDNRGHLVELVKGKGSQSQVFFSTTKPGITRGNHFHFNKIERFCILQGNARISMRKVGCNKKNHYIISGNDNKVIDMPILYTHNITNIGSSELVCVFWVNEIFNEKNTDTFFEKV